MNILVHISWSIFQIIYSEQVLWNENAESKHVQLMTISLYCPSERFADLSFINDVRDIPDPTIMPAEFLSFFLSLHIQWA